jgi:hypothetical protein
VAAASTAASPKHSAFSSHQVDHIVSEKHGGATTADNLALSCVLCNRRKGSDLASIDPATGQLAALFHPRRQAWSDHFALASASIMPVTPEGRATVALLQLNDPARIEERMELIRAGSYASL